MCPGRVEHVVSTQGIRIVLVWKGDTPGHLLLCAYHRRWAAYVLDQYRIPHAKQIIHTVNFSMTDLLSVIQAALNYLSNCTLTFVGYSDNWSWTLEFL